MLMPGIMFSLNNISRSRKKQNQRKKRERIKETKRKKARDRKSTKETRKRNKKKEKKKETTRSPTKCFTYFCDVAQVCMSFTLISLSVFKTENHQAQTKQKQVLHR